MIVQVFVAEHQCVHSLGRQLLGAVLDETLIAPVRKALGQPSRQTDGSIHLSQQHHASIARHKSSAEIGHDLPWAETLKLERSLLTVCRRPGSVLRYS